MMKKVFLVMVIVLITVNGYGQIPQWQWAKAGNGAIYGQEVESLDIANDANGNIYITGWFADTLIFGNDSLFSNGNPVVFLIKFDSSGNELWSKISSYDGEGFGVTTDRTGNIYITGFFTGPTITFDSIAITNMGGEDAFVVKYTAAGQILWARDIGGPGGEEGYAVTTDSSGNVYMTGFYTSAPLIFANDTLYRLGVGSDILLVKFDSLGNKLWAVSGGGPYSDYGNSVTTDNFGAVYITGYFSSPYGIFGADSFLTNNGLDFFIAKYATSDGHLMWAKNAGGTNNSRGQSMASDKSGNVFCTGNFTGSIILNSDTMFTTAIGKSFFIAKYDSSGNVLWAKNTTGPAGSNTFGLSLVTDSLGNVYISSAMGEVSNGDSILYLDTLTLIRPPLWD